MDWIFSTHLRFHEIFLETFIKQYYVVEQISRERVGAWKYLIMLLKKAPNLILRRIKNFLNIYLLFNIFLQNVWSVSNNVLLWIHGPILTEPGPYVRHFGLYGHIPICEENLLDSQNWLKKQSKLTENKTKNLLAHYSDDIPWCFF